MRTCEFEKCVMPHQAKGLCVGHYRQFRKGQKLRPLAASLGRGKSLDERMEMYTDKSGDCWVWVGGKSLGYGQISVNGKPAKAHRIAFEKANGSIPDGLILDHKCRNRACVNPEHLHAVTPKMNAENVIHSSRSKTGARGVVAMRNGRFRVSVTHNRETYHGGVFADLELAKQAAKKLRGVLFTNSLTD